ncbi:opacity protein-like surface antigen [Sphingomonas aerophila]|uniref:Opacity protein-like surface antigen n=1 Tax=Sphingomonas aerophila TaxID=1344948 RepID=A0A7W9BH88_9SPHN|nr:opacity protein-like surface antigen [Sphingomonas aerophila]
MLTTLLFATAATALAPAATAADVARCVITAANKLSASGHEPQIAARKAVEICEPEIAQYSAERDALVTKEAGYAPPASNSAQWRRAVTDGMEQMALRSIQAARNQR